MRRDAVRVQDHDDAAVAQDRVTGEHLDVAQNGRDRLHNDFLGIEHPVDHDAEAIGADLSDDDECVIFRFHFASIELQELAQRNQRQQPVAQAQDRRVLDPLDLQLAIGGGAHQLDHADLRDREALARAFDDQRGDDRQGERDLDDEGRALAGRRAHLDGAADLLDVGLDHVHADTATGDAGHLGGGGEAGLENVLLDLLLAHLLQLGFAGQAVLQDLRLDPVDRETAAVVADLDDDMAAFVIGVERDLAGFRFARAAALLRPFQAVVGGIAHHVGQRVLDHLQDLAIQLGVLADHDQFDLLLQFVAEVAHQARQLGPRIADRLHARLHDAFLQLGRDMVEALQRAGEFAVLLLAQDLQHLVAGEHELAHHRHQVLKQFDVDADALIGDRAVLCFGGFALGGRGHGGSGGGLGEHRRRHGFRRGGRFGGGPGSGVRRRVGRAGAGLGAAHDLVAAGVHDRHDHRGQMRRDLKGVQCSLHVAGERIEMRIVHAPADRRGMRAFQVDLAEGVRAAADQREILAHAALQPVHVDALEQVLDAKIAHDAGEHDFDHRVDRAHAADLLVDRLRIA